MILDLLEKKKLLGQAVFVSRAGQPDQRLETDLRKLRAEGPKSVTCPLFWFMPEKANPKLEIRNSKQIQMTEIRNSKPLAHKPQRSAGRGMPFYF